MTHLTFMTTSTSLIVSILIVICSAVIGIYSWRRSGYRPLHGCQELLRVFIIAIIAVLFNQPEWVEEFRPASQPVIAVLWDNSRSMETLDVLPREASKGNILSRAQQVQALLKRPEWQSLAEQYEVLSEPINHTDSSQDTDLSQPLLTLQKQTHQLLGVVLISDGDWNAGSPPAEAAARMRMQEIPVHTVIIGSPTRLPDLELTNLDLPTFGIANKIVRIPFTIDSSLPQEFITTVSLKTSGGETITKEVRIAANARTSDVITWKPTTEGDYTVSLEIPRHIDEAIFDNNLRSAPIAIRQEQLKVLIVESYPRWEYRYLRNALSRDPGVEVSCLLFHPGLSKTGGGSTDYLKQFPATLEELAQYDVVFLGDVGVEPDQLTSEQCRLLKGLVEQQASGLIFMPGWQGRQLSLTNTELSDLYPVLLDPAQQQGWGTRTPAQLELTESGRRSLLTKLADVQEENMQVWETLPGFQWYAAVVRAKAGTELLAVHQEVSNEYGRLPLLVTRPYGAGKVLFMGTDGAWRWRKGVEDKYHYRFWGQVIRWMAYQRNMAKGETMRLLYLPEQPTLRQTLSLHAHVMSRTGEPLIQGDVTAVVQAPSKQTQTIRFQSEGSEWGVFHAQYTPQEVGEHKLTLTCRQTGAVLESRFFVQGDLLEPIGKPARPDVLAEVARITNAQMVSPEEINQVLNSLKNLPQPPMSIRRLQLWSNPIVAGIVICLLAGFWIWRKAVGLI